MKTALFKLFSLLVYVIAFSAAKGKDTNQLTIGIIAPLTGTSDYFGSVIANGVRLAFRDHPLAALVVYDDQSKPELSSIWLDRCVADGCIAVIGPVETHTAATAIPLADAKKITIVTPSATGDYLSQLSKQGWFFRAISSDAPRAREVAEWITRDHPDGAALIVNEDSPPDPTGTLLYGTAIGNAAFKRLTELAYPVERVLFQRDNIDIVFEEALRKQLASKEIHAVGIFGRSVDTKNIAAIVRKFRAGMPIYLISPGKDMFHDSDLKNNVFAETDTIIESTPREDLAKFRVKYSAAFPNSPDPIDQYATFGYDTAMIVLGAIERMKKTDESGNSLPIAAVREQFRLAMEATPNDRVGLMSEGGFTTNHELSFRPHKLALVEGQWEQLGVNPPPPPTPSNKRNIPLLIAAGILVVCVLVLFLRRIGRKPMQPSFERPLSERRRSIVVFIHGLGGDMHGTWQKFPELVFGDESLATSFDVGFYGFPTGIITAPWEKAISVSTLADGLGASLRIRYSHYKEIVLVCHSLGGVVARKMIQKLIMSTDDRDKSLLHRVCGVALYGVPNEGSALANIGSLIAWWHRHLKQLCRNTDFLNDLNEWWVSPGAQEQLKKLPILLVIGASDMVVPERSAFLIGSSVHKEVIVDPDVNQADHQGIVKPKNAQSFSFLALKQFLETRCVKIVTDTGS